MPVVPELRFAPRFTRPRVPGGTGRVGAADPGPPSRSAFFHRKVHGRAIVAAGAGGSCLHDPLLPSRSGRACWSLYPAGRFQTAAQHGRESSAGRTSQGLPPAPQAAAARRRARHQPDPAPNLSPARTALARSGAPRGCQPAIPQTRHVPGIDHPQRGSTPTRRTSPDRARASPSWSSTGSRCCSSAQAWTIMRARPARWRPPSCPCTACPAAGQAVRYQRSPDSER
jgi:hypothetical protein